MGIVDWQGKGFAQPPMRHVSTYYVATYGVRAGAEMWIGRVAHGRRDLTHRSALQVYIEHPEGKVVLARDVETLKQDVFVSLFPGHA